MIYSFGPFRYDSEQRVLFRGADVVPLAPKATDLLHVLVERRGRIVEKSELMALLWPDTTVEEVGLARNISLLRKVLDEEGAGESYIETVSRRGYRFAPSEAARNPRRRRLWPVAAVVAAMAFGGGMYWQFYVPSRFLRRGPGIVALAVVPFEGSSDPQFIDALVASLSRLNGLQVVSPTTVRRHQRAGLSMGLMGRLLGLDVLVEGSMRRSAGRLQVTARLTDVHTGRVIWSDMWDRAAGAPDPELVREIAAQAGAHLAIERFP